MMAKKKILRHLKPCIDQITGDILQKLDDDDDAKLWLCP